MAWKITPHNPYMFRGGEVMSAGFRPKPSDVRDLHAGYMQVLNDLQQCRARRDEAEADLDETQDNLISAQRDLFARLIAAAEGENHRSVVEVYPVDVPGWSGQRPIRELSLVDWLREQQEMTDGE